MSEGNTRLFAEGKIGAPSFVKKLLDKFTDTNYFLSVPIMLMELQCSNSYISDEDAESAFLPILSPASSWIPDPRESKPLPLPTRALDRIARLKCDYLAVFVFFSACLNVKWAKKDWFTNSSNEEQNTL